MFGEVVTPHEALLTLGTLKALVPWEAERTVSKACVQTLPQPQREAAHGRAPGEPTWPCLHIPPACPSLLSAGLRLSALLTYLAPVSSLFLACTVCT